MWKLLSLFFLLPASVLAQDYQSVRSDFIHFFSDDSEIQHGMRIDSTLIVNGDSILYNYEGVRSYEPGESFQAYVPLWLGPKVIVRPNGDNLLFNNNQDTILIKTLAQINDSWVLFNINPTSYLEGTVLNIGSQTVLDSVVDVKTVSLQAKDLQGNPISHLMNGRSIQISKTLGIVQGFDFHLFPNDTSYIRLAGMENPDRGVYRLTNDEVYDFQVGDEFHFRKEGGDEPWVERRIETVTNVFNNNSRTVAFDVLRSVVSYDGFSEQYTISSYSTTETYQNLHSRLTRMPGEITLLDTIHSENFGLGGIVGTLDENRLEYHQSGRLAAFTGTNSEYFYPDSTGYWVIVPTISGGTSVSSKFGSGIGRTNYSSFDSDGVFFNTEIESLVYFKKGNEEWGDPFSMSLMLGSSEIEPVEITVFPNPVKVGGSVQLGRMYDYATLSDLTGKLLLSKTNVQNLEITNLPVGIYLLRVATNDKATTLKLVVVN